MDVTALLCAGLVWLITVVILAVIVYYLHFGRKRQ